MSVNASDLAKLYPLDSLRPEHLDQVAKETTIEELGKGKELFKAGATDENTIYVLSGVIRCDYPDGKSKKTDASSIQGRYALGDLQPRRFNAKVESMSATIAGPRISATTTPIRTATAGCSGCCRTAPCTRCRPATSSACSSASRRSRWWAVRSSCARATRPTIST